MTEIARLTENLAPTPAAYLQAARRVLAGEAGDLRTLRVAFLSTAAAQMLEPFLVVEAARRGLHLMPWFGPFGHLEEQALDAHGPLYTYAPEAIVVLARLEELAPGFGGHFSAERVSRAALLEDVVKRLHTLLQSVRQSTSAVIFVANFPPPARLAAGVGDALMEAGETALVQQANSALAAVCRGLPGVFIFDLARTATVCGLRGWFDARLFALARQPWSVSAEIALARDLTRTLRAAFVAPAKCLVLDADETLWGGILGEEGLGGIALGSDYPGNVFRDFQKYLRTLKDRGVLLALASKNSEAEVLTVLTEHPDCLLRPEDFAAHRINWREKSANLRDLATELNLGLEALVLFDDSPFEREEVRRALPAVTVIEVPADPLRYIETIEESAAFDQLTITAEDRHRADSYRQQLSRAEASRAATSPEEFLAGLDMVATIGQVTSDTLPRVAQLLAKTNQFNLTTRRHSAAQIADLIAGGAMALWLRLADRFGDHGLVGVALAAPSGSQWVIDTFLLSCRVIGRGVESILLSQLATSVRSRSGRELVGEYLPTGKNALVADFYPRHDFSPVGENRWIKNLSEAIPAPGYIRIEFHE